MESSTPSQFRFLRYLVKESSVKISDANISDHIIIKMDLKASVTDENPCCELSISVDLNDENSNLNINLVVTGYFEAFNVDPVKKKSFISRNAPAILFPYVRAYISTVTAQSGISPIIIPTVNLVRQGEGLFNALMNK